MQKDYTCYNPRQAALDQARALLTKAAQAAIAAGTLPEAPLPDFIVEIPADPKNGDVASNLAMAGARAFRKAPRMIAEAIAAQADLTGTGFEKLEIAGPGFMNLYLAPQFYADVVLAACSNPEYGRTNYGAGKKYNVEFVSANPTGPMHLGNARGGALGDCLAAVLDWSGHEVCREFYINDAGNQIQKFGKSLAVRYLQLQAGEEAFPLPEDCCQGADILAHAQAFASQPKPENDISPKEKCAALVEACKTLSQSELYDSEAFGTLKDTLTTFVQSKFTGVDAQAPEFGKSLAVRYLQLQAGEEAFPLPEDCYQGADILAHAQNFNAEHPGEYAPQTEACKALSQEELYTSEAFEALKNALVGYALPKNIAALETDLAKYRIKYDVWFRESTLHDSGSVQAVVDKLLETGACYKAEDGAIMYKSAQYSAKYGAANRKRDEEEDKDEVLVRANGIPTYFAADIAYHYNKMAVRSFDTVIDIWGADHHGHVARMKGAMDAIGLDGSHLDVVLMQLVRLLQDGKPVRMSKRTGKAITLTDLLDEVPIDSARMFFNMNDADSAVDFDLDLAVKQNSDNPVYYVQYAHARICSILKKLESEGVPFMGAEQCDATLLTSESERELIRMLSAFPAEIVLAAQNYSPSRITRYVINLAGAFHKFYNSCHIKGADPALQQARMALCLGVKNVIFNVLTMFKINVPEVM